VRVWEAFWFALFTLMICLVCVTVTEKYVTEREARKAPTADVGIRCGEPMRGWTLMVNRKADGGLACTYFEPFTPPIEGVKQ